MTELNLEEFKQILTTERDNLLAKSNSKGLTIDENESADPVDASAQNYAKNVLISVSQNEAKMLQMIDEALERIEDEEFGECLNCKKFVGIKRLEAIPWAKYCINCQELLEKGLIDE
ncbi:MAG: TraR/DksA family transcriptional regulator [Pyrinomonadaceae bacterium]|nr:TraR/DksA family transcriptional regulator [Pyrinomonadaceae bacterium]